MVSNNTKKKMLDVLKQDLRIAERKLWEKRRAVTIQRMRLLNAEKDVASVLRDVDDIKEAIAITRNIEASPAVPLSEYQKKARALDDIEVKEDEINE